MHRQLIVRLILLCVLFSPAKVMSQGNLRLGQLEIHPYISIKETFSDNIYFTSTDEKNDYIATTVPGLRLEFPFRMHKMTLDYNAVFNRYDEFDGENTTDHNASGLLDFKLGSFIGLKLQDVYAKGHEPRSSSSTGVIERYETNAAIASITYQMAEVSKVQIDYTKNAWNFEISDFRERDEDLVSGYIYYRFLPKTSIFFEYDHKYVDFDIISRDLNNDVDSALVGLSWEISETSKGSLKVGYTWKDFQDASRGDYETWTGSLDMRHEFSDYTSIKMVGLRAVNETQLTATRYFVTTGAFAEFNHRFLPKISATLRGGYGKDDFSDLTTVSKIGGGTETSLRKDQTSTLGVGLKYAIQDWMEFALDYNQKDRDSNQDINDYLENSYSLTVNLTL